MRAPERPLRRRRVAWAGGALLGLALLLWAGTVNLASLAWSHQLLAGLPPLAGSRSALQDRIGAGGALGQAALDAAPPNPLAPYEPVRQRAMTELAAGRMDAAAADLRRALDRAGTDSGRMIYESVLAYGETVEAAGDRARAERAFRLLIAQVPGRRTAYVRLGELLQAGHAYPAAIAAFRQAVALPDQGEDAAMEAARAGLGLGVLEAATGDPAAAEAAYRAAVQADPTNAGWYWTWNACMNLGYMAAARPDLPAARAWFTQALRVARTPDQQDKARAQLARLAP